MKHFCLFIFLTFCLFLSSCSHIDEGNRLIDVPHAVISRAVLIEDFTGQRCVNCPNAASEIERLQEEYGRNNVVAVAIHSGPLAIYSTDKVTGLRTSLGDDYYDYWGVEAEPSGLINRTGGVMLLDKWAAKIHQELQTEAPIELTVRANSSDDGTVEIDVEYLAVKDFVGKLQVWITEDRIVAPQMLPDGTLVWEYVHNHVLRSAVNGPWGVDVTWAAGGQGKVSYISDVQIGWNTKNLSVVVFIYNDSGVQQVCLAPVK